ncbi:hypothetical protein [Streptomyces sp. DSM 40750]|uniref:hypothetical protein n=1 Tax=Streptomyces sp. DSM 40750 TaxID=2801030 RepID=UPI00214AF175|nr:hypothetical protein [Streptomyces sp. DSM 40750]UUU24088.1 hypothetical protein JIX55_29630 [Streptomyces sp. DSM 40750]
MPRGRHRHSPPLHRLLPPTAIAGVSLVCALGPWIFSEPAVLRVTAAVAAATATVGAAVMRRWDVEAGKRVADLTRARASDEWRHEERAAELETDLDESRELRTKLEHKLRAKRTELAGLRNEHAALLRRYATAETERASALEGRRLLEIEATAPEGARALPAAGSDADAGAGAGAADGAEADAAARATPVPPQGVPAPGAPWASWEAASKAASEKASKKAKGGAVAASASGEADAAAEDDAEVDAEVDADAEGDAEAEFEVAADEEASGAKKLAPAVFSPTGSSLFLRANSALDRIITQRGSVTDSDEEEAGAEVEAEGDAEAGAEAEIEGAVEAVADVVVVTGGVAEDAALTEVDGESGAENAVESESGLAVGGDVDAEVEADTKTDAIADADADADADAESGVAGVAGVEEGNASEAEGDSADDSADVPVDESIDAPAADSADASTLGATAESPAPKGGPPKDPNPEGDPDGPTDGGTRQGRSAGAEDEPVPVLTAEEDDAAGKSVAVGGHERAAAESVPAVSVPARSTRLEHVQQTEHAEQTEQAALPALSAVRPAGHFTVPTAVAVVPAAPQRRTAVEGGFDFFGTQKGADTLEAVQNEDLADVVGQEALALHKAESEAQFKRVDEASRGVGQVIDLTAHDETEQIDVQGLRTAAS